MMGIYAIVNMVNGKRYIGSAVSIEKRWREHRRDFQIDDHHCVYLYRAWVKYGAETFNWIVLEEVADRNLLVEREQWWIDTTPSELLYNTCRVAGSTLGVIPGVETRAKMSAARKGRPKSAEHRAKIGLAHKGRTYSPDILAKMKAGRNRPEIKEKVAAAHRGRIRSAEARAKMSAAQKGKIISAEHRAKMSAALKGRTMSAESIAKRQATIMEKGGVSQSTREKLRAANKGKIVSPETRAKLSAVKSGKHIGTMNPHAALTESDVLTIREKIANGEKHKDIAEQFGVKKACITKIATGRTWKHLLPKDDVA